MDTNRRCARWEQTSGLLSLEASISLTIFIFLMLFMCSFFVVFEARNEVGHVLLTTADSLGLDSLANEAADDDTIQGMLYELYGTVHDSNGTFTETSKWYDGDETQLQNVIKKRFVAYMSGGDMDEANRILDQLNVVGGIDGLDFSQSNVKEGRLYLVVRYKLDYEFRFFGLDSIELQQSCCSKLWK